MLNRRRLAQCAIVTATSLAFVQPEDNRVNAPEPFTATKIEWASGAVTRFVGGLAGAR
jgi:hypothetical protein